MHTMKFDKGGMSRILAHVTRSRETVTESRIDDTLTKYNRDLMPVMTSEQMDTYKAMAKRKDAVLLVSTVLTLPQELKYASRTKQTEFFECALEGLQKHIGGVPAFATVHFDETTPHLHYGSIPVTEDGRLCAKEICNRQMLRELHPAVTEHVRANGFDVNLYEEDELLRQIEHDLGKSKSTMHEFRQEAYSNQLLQEASEVIDKNLQIAQRDLQRASRPVKRQKGENRAEYKERRSEWIEVRKDEFERLRAFERQFDAVPNMLEAQRILEEAARRDEYLEQEQRALDERHQQLTEWTQQQRRDLDRLVDERAQARLREAMGRTNTSREKRLDEFCAGIKFSTGESVLEKFQEQERELMRKTKRSLGHEH